VVVIDRLTYAGRRDNLDGLPEDRLEFVEADICDRAAVANSLKGCSALINFAAESHVDRSVDSPEDFIRTDVTGTFVLLEACRDAGIRMVQISTDEVYGSIDEGTFTEQSHLDPSSPYSASKASGDLLVSAFHKTYGLEALIVRASNNYGTRQHPEKLIPLTILNALHGDPIPIYGDGKQVRNWLFVEDFCRAIETVLKTGLAGEVYNVGGPDEVENIEVVERILDLTGADRDLISFVADRPGHDVRYSLSSGKTEALGWKAEVSFSEGLERTVEWYRENRAWWEPVRSGEYREWYLKQYGVSLTED
jgi:dTDP-glucose 4,6-dehydratase